MSIKEIEIPTYSLGEELWNSISHGLGALFAMIASIMLAIKVAPNKDPFEMAAVIIYGISMIILFAISCVYHALGKNDGKRVMRILDHDMIFLLVAGSYTSYTL